MKISTTFDLYLCDYFLPKVSEDSFKNRIFCLFALTYISVFKLPRKFLINYFRGNGKEMVIESKKMIISNYVVFNRFFEEISTSRNKGFTKGAMSICQTDVHNPNYRYSVGSFTINYSLNGGSIEISVNSDYNFKPNPDRLTKHLHSWLYSMTTKGYAMSFKVRGNSWTTSFSELASIKDSNKPKRMPKNTYVY